MKIYGVTSDNGEHIGHFNDVACRLREFQHTAHLCSKEQINRLTTLLMRQEMWAALLFTPCELWPYIRGRTLWIMGDSQVDTVSRLGLAQPALKMVVHV